MGEAINLVNNFKVDNVIFNCGPYNNLEKELIKANKELAILTYKNNELESRLNNIRNNKILKLGMIPIRIARKIRKRK